MKSFRLVALDMDGTLLRSDFQISYRARSVVQEVLARGVKITLATGRMYAATWPYARELGIDLPLITYGGALVKTSLSGEELYKRPLPRESACRVIALGREAGCTVNLYLEDNLYVEKVTDFARRYAARSGVRLHVVPDLIKAMETGPLKVLFIDEEAIINRLEIASHQEFAQTIHVIKSQHNFLEFHHPEATKEDSLARVAAYLGIGLQETLVVGDNYNDVEMFKRAGLGVAMGNARPEIQKEADYVTASNDEDGAALALEKFILKRG